MRGASTMRLILNYSGETIAIRGSTALASARSCWVAALCTIASSTSIATEAKSINLARMPISNWTVASRMQS